MSRTDAIYGELPQDLGPVELDHHEMMFWMYCPIKVPGTDQTVIPPNLTHLAPAIRMVQADCADIWRDQHVYVTAKTMWTTGENPGNRPGWHSDGFLTDDLNYIWYDSNPTVFFHSGNLYDFTADHTLSLEEMHQLCEYHPSWPHYYDCGHLLKLDQTVLHKVDTDVKPRMRTFVKISVSRHIYALQGNSINHLLGTDWQYQTRKQERNCPIGEMYDQNR
jgi:hypothetical protein